MGCMLNMTTSFVVLHCLFSNPASAEHPLSRRGHNAILLHTRGRPSRQFAAITPIVIKAVVVLRYVRAGASSIHCNLIFRVIVKGGKHFSKEAGGGDLHNNRKMLQRQQLNKKLQDVCGVLLFKPCT